MVKRKNKHSKILKSILFISGIILLLAGLMFFLCGGNIQDFIKELSVEIFAIVVGIFLVAFLFSGGAIMFKKLKGTL